MTPQTLLDENLEPVHFDGPAYSPEHDQARLTGQILRVFEVMKSGDWMTLQEIEHRIFEVFGRLDPQASISAQLRHLRKPRFGGHTVDRRHRGDKARGLYEYRLVAR
jgi:hypothetical protein